MNSIKWNVLDGNTFSSCIQCISPSANHLIGRGICMAPGLTDHVRISVADYRSSLGSLRRRSFINLPESYIYKSTAPTALGKGTSVVVLAARWRWGEISTTQNSLNRWLGFNVNICQPIFDFFGVYRSTIFRFWGQDLS